MAIKKCILKVINCQRIMSAWGKVIDKSFRKYRRECQLNNQINKRLGTEEKFRRLMLISSGGKKSFNFLTTDNGNEPTQKDNLNV